jgi:hypothetical protein
LASSVNIADLYLDNDYGCHSKVRVVDVKSVKQGQVSFICNLKQLNFKYDNNNNICKNILSK